MSTKLDRAWTVALVLFLMPIVPAVMLVASPSLATLTPLAMLGMLMLAGVLAIS